VTGILEAQEAGRPRQRRRPCDASVSRMEIVRPSPGVDQSTSAGPARGIRSPTWSLRSPVCFEMTQACVRVPQEPRDSNGGTVGVGAGAETMTVAATSSPETNRKGLGVLGNIIEGFRQGVR
jgi:hypothetical protein